MNSAVSWLMPVDPAGSMDGDGSRHVLITFGHQALFFPVPLDLDRLMLPGWRLGFGPVAILAPVELPHSGRDIGLVIPSPRLYLQMLSVTLDHMKSIGLPFEPVGGGGGGDGEHEVTGVHPGQLHGHGVAEVKVTGKDEVNASLVERAEEGRPFVDQVPTGALGWCCWRVVDHEHPQCLWGGFEVLLAEADELACGQSPARPVHVEPARAA